MKLMTKEIEKKIPGLYAQEEKGGEAIAYVKFFTPWTRWTWYGTEFDPIEKRFFGLVQGQEEELGYFMLEELASVNGPFGLKIERDLGFKPTPIKALRKAA